MSTNSLVNIENDCGCVDELYSWYILLQDFLEKINVIEYTELIEMLDGRDVVLFSGDCSYRYTVNEINECYKELKND